jgi:flagellar biosynthetic protein FliO
MRIVLRNLLVIALLALPIYGQQAAPADQKADAGPNGHAVVPDAAPPAVPAEAPSSDIAAEETHEADLGFPIFRTLGGLGVVLCLMAGAYFAAKKFAPRYFAKGISDRNLKVIETLSMGDKRSIAMIEVGNSRFLVGNTPHQINLLAALPEAFSAVSEPEKSVTSKDILGNEPVQPFRNLFEAEKRRPTQYAGNPLPDDIRMKMRQLRASLER